MGAQLVKVMQYKVCVCMKLPDTHSLACMQEKTKNIPTNLGLGFTVLMQQTVLWWGWESVAMYQQIMTSLNVYCEVNAVIYAGWESIAMYKQWDSQTDGLFTTVLSAHSCIKHGFSGMGGWHLQFHYWAGNVIQHETAISAGILGSPWQDQAYLAIST